MESAELQSQAEQKYLAMGLEIRYVKDKPGEVYEPHSHGAVYLFTTSGSAKVRLGNQDWLNVKAGDEIEISDGQLHEAVAGSEGWEYVFAASTDEMKRQGL